MTRPPSGTIPSVIPMWSVFARSPLYTTQSIASYSITTTSDLSYASYSARSSSASFLTASIASDPLCLFAIAWSLSGLPLPRPAGSTIVEATMEATVALFFVFLFLLFCGLFFVFYLVRCGDNSDGLRGYSLGQVDGFLSSCVFHIAYMLVIVSFSGTLSDLYAMHSL